MSHQKAKREIKVEIEWTINYDKKRISQVYFTCDILDNQYIRRR